MVNLDETGKDGEFVVNGQERTVSDHNYTITYNTATGDYEDRPDQHTSHTTRYLEGEASLDGSSRELRQQFIRDDGEPRQNVRGTLRDSEEAVRIRRVRITEYGREFERGSKTVTNVSFRADKFRFV